jgi:hypothetical protein
MKNSSFYLLLITSVSCISTKSTLQNVDDNAPIPKYQEQYFCDHGISKNSKYGYDKDYPINVFYRNTRDESINQGRFLNALAGPKGEEITFKN